MCLGTPVTDRIISASVYFSGFSTSDLVLPLMAAQLVPAHQDTAAQCTQWFDLLLDQILNNYKIMKSYI